MKKVFCFIGFICFLFASNACFGSDNILNVDNIVCADNSCEVGGSHFYDVDSLLDYSSKFLGVHYVYGGKTPKGFDCSGFLSYVFKKFNISTPYRAMDYANFGQKIEEKEVQPGDVVCFTGRNSYSRTIGHVGIVTKVENGKITFINAACSAGISYATTSNVYWAPRVLGYRRIF